MKLELDTSESQYLLYLWARNGNQFKKRLRHAWETGDYSGLTVAMGSNEESMLQRLRNTHGPSWLHGLRKHELEAGGK